jgi:biotin operon repressor
MNTESKHNRIKRRLLAGFAISGQDALKEFGVYRLSSVIHRLRKEGLNIKTTMVQRPGYSFAKYHIENAIS